MTVPSRALLAWCDHCQATFVAGAFGGGGMALGGGAFGSNVTHIGHMRTGPEGAMITDSQTSCPTCNRMADIPDGLYDMASGVVRRGVDLLRQMDSDAAARLAEALRQRQAGELDDQAVIDAAPNAESKQWVKQILRNQWAPCLVGIVLALLLYFHQEVDSTKSTQENLRGQEQTQAKVARLEQQESQLQAVVRELLNDQQAAEVTQAIPGARRAPPQASKRYTLPKGHRR